MRIAGRVKLSNRNKKILILLLCYLVLPILVALSPWLYVEYFERNRYSEKLSSFFTSEEIQNLRDIFIEEQLQIPAPDELRAIDQAKNLLSRHVPGWLKVDPIAQTRISVDLLSEAIRRARQCHQAALYEIPDLSSAPFCPRVAPDAALVRLSTAASLLGQVAHFSSSNQNLYINGMLRLKDLPDLEEFYLTTITAHSVVAPTNYGIWSRFELIKLSFILLIGYIALARGNPDIVTILSALFSINDKSEDRGSGPST